MKLDILKGQWLDIVFEGRNKKYGAYELRKDNPKTTMRAFVFGAIIFALLVSSPILARLVPDASDEDAVLDQKITTVKLPPKEKPPEVLPPPPPPPPKVDQVKFVKPVVAKAEEVVEEPPKIKEIVDKKLGAETIKGDPDAPLTIEPVGTGPKEVIDDNQIYNTAGIEVKPDFPGGINKFYNYVANNFKFEEEGVSGRVFVTFVVEKDGSLTDIKVVRDIGFGSGAEAIRVLKKSPRWIPGEQNGKKVRVLYSLPIAIQAPK
ncbi:MAG TPA: energy transducer TonB [Flavobacterium sp.]|nr:energy transducer TonB [Flavobacterium sp.]